LDTIDLSGNQLGSLELPSGLTALVSLNLRDNQLTSLTLPADMQQLAELFVDGNPLTTLVLSEPFAATNLATLVGVLREQGVAVFTYPLTVQLILPRATEGGEFEFTFTGPPGAYAILGSVDLTTWNKLVITTNTLGSAVFTDETAPLSVRKFYRATPIQR